MRNGFADFVILISIVFLAGLLWRAAKHILKTRFPDIFDSLKKKLFFIRIPLNCIKYYWQRYCLYIKKGPLLFQGKKLRYFNNDPFYLTERAVEIPIIYEAVKKNRNKRILEIGNVLSQYFKANWDIVDKFEKAPRVINEDIVDYSPQKRYDLIVSISTFEHIGHDESVESPGKDDNKIIEAVNHVKFRLLTAEGTFMMTVPIGYNSNLDKKLFNEELKFDDIYYYKRISADNRWRECKREDALIAKFNSPYEWANVIAVCVAKGLTPNT